MREEKKKERGQASGSGTASRPKRSKAGVRGAHLQPDLLVDKHWAVTEGDGVAEAGLSLDGLVAEVHEDLGALSVGMEEQRRGREPPG